MAEYQSKLCKKKQLKVQMYTVNKKLNGKCFYGTNMFQSGFCTELCTEFIDSINSILIKVEVRMQN